MWSASDIDVGTVPGVLQVTTCPAIAKAIRTAMYNAKDKDHVTIVLYSPRVVTILQPIDVTIPSTGSPYWTGKVKNMLFANNTSVSPLRDACARHAPFLSLTSRLAGCRLWCGRRYRPCPQAPRT
jgi:hypothetical protein